MFQFSTRYRGSPPNLVPNIERILNELINFYSSGIIIFRKVVGLDRVNQFD